MSGNLTGAAPLPVRVEAIEQQLRERLHPTRLEVLDESAAHAGHSGANAEGYGSHFRVRIACPGFDGKRGGGRDRLFFSSLPTFLYQCLHALAIEILDSP